MNVRASIPPRVAAALDRGRDWASLPWRAAQGDAGPFRRHVAVGDPQASFETYLRVLDRHDLLGEDGRLRPDVALLSAGDHFDYEGDLATVQEDGHRLLGWLAGHPARQVVILAGNHDLCRVVELAGVTDDRFEPGTGVDRHPLDRERRQAKLALERLGDALAQLDGVADRPPLPFDERERP
jgi:hypothetical protein